ncbi:MinD/ParA family protein [Saccharopolyspora gloriosae]|uniref:MinD-like ATPase involved in chromosome partitioning or flagellar assembly n=1 Tax=Saccharopolyspora gloriosae TaxID=455344 RepID=A0A840N9T6_9PSEU|nr:MinD-like ATPase involved in chromosome partitioning or flagellar assembly [Saccharopolyspora gloriosae]
MTGRYEEPETQRDAGSASPGADSAQQANGATDHATPDYGDGAVPAAPQPYAEPGTTPNTPLQGAGNAGGPQPYYPGGNPNVQSGQSVPDAGPQYPQYTEQTPSGPQPNQQQPNQPQPNQSGPYPVPGGPSGPHQVPGGQSGPYPAPGGQSGPYQVAGNSGPYQVPGGQSGPYQVGGQPNPYAPVAGPFPQQQGYPQQPPHGPAPQGGQPQGQQPAGQQPTGQQAGVPFGKDLASSQLLRQTKRAPQSGWRKALYVASGRSINLGESASDLRRRELIGRINQPLQGCYKIAMLSLKGGVGKTTTTATLGSTFSSLRGDRVIAVDANPDRGTLSQKIPLETTATVRHLLRDAQRIRKYSDVRSYTSQGPSRLEILASEQDPAVSEAFSEDDYQRTVTLLEHFYNIVLTDCGTGLMHSAMKGVLDVADSLVIVSSSSIDGARSASATLDWLDAHGYGQLVSRSVAVINSVRPGSGKVDVDKLSAHFGSRCRAVSRIPFDPHLEEGAEVELDQLAAPTRLALLELAAIVADDFPQAFGRQRQA